MSRELVLFAGFGGTMTFIPIDGPMSWGRGQDETINGTRRQMGPRPVNHER
jgi:hypothetical protein